MTPDDIRKLANKLDLDHWGTRVGIALTSESAGVLLALADVLEAVRLNDDLALFKALADVEALHP